MAGPENKNFHQTNLGALTFRYEAVAPWTDQSLRKFSSVQNASYPPLIRTKDAGYIQVYSPEYDMLIKEPGKPPLLFSDAHNRLLFEAQNGLLQSNAQRVVINIDAHSDFLMGLKQDNYTPDDVHHGNWGGIGAGEGYWGTFIHVSSLFNGNKSLLEEREVGIAHDASLINVSYAESGIANPQQTVVALKQLIGDRPFILTCDADEFAQHLAKQYTPEQETILHTLLEGLMQLPTLELVHFSVSPDYCPSDDAKKEWDVVRNIYAQIKP